MAFKLQARAYKSTRNLNLKVSKIYGAPKIIKARRAYFKATTDKRLKREELRVRAKGDKKLQDLFTDRQKARRDRSIKRGIAKRKRLGYQKQKGDIALKGAVEKETKVARTQWQANFYSSNVWRFKIRSNNLLVQFLDGSIYLYFGVGRLFLGMLRTGSKGKFVWRNLINKGVRFIKVS